MRSVSHLALGLMIALTGTAVAVSPAIAAKKEKAASGPNLKLSDAFRGPIVKAEQAIGKNDFAGAKAAIAEAAAVAKSPDEIYQLNATKLNLSIAAKDAPLQGEAISAMLDTGLVPATQAGQFNAIAADNDVAAKRYDSAIARTQKALELGYKPSTVNATAAQAWFGKAGTTNVSAEPARTATANGLKSLRAAVDAMKASGEATPPQWYAIGVSRAEAARLPEIKDWAKMAYEAAPTGENLRTLLRLYQRETPTLSNRENLDVLRLMGVSGGLSLGADYAEYAEMASRTGIHGEVVSVIDKGRAAGKLQPSQAGDFYLASKQKIASDKASLPAAAADARKSANGKIAAATGDAYLGYGDYAQAAAMFRLALQKGSVDAGEMNSRLGIAAALSGDTAGAKAAFEQVTTGARRDIAQYWLLWLSKKA